jgi:hypothetical protein
MEQKKSMICKFDILQRMSNAKQILQKHITDINSEVENYKKSMDMIQSISYIENLYISIIIELMNINISELNRNWRDIHNFSQKITSQFGQDGIIHEIFQRIGTTNKFYVEFGFNSHDWLGSTGPNCYQLHLGGWNGLLLDSDNENLEINLYKHFLTPENICSIFAMYNVPKEPDFISIDVDSIDLWLFRSILKQYRPRVVSIETSNYLPTDSTLTVIPTARWNNCRVYGTSLGALKCVSDEFGYTLIAWEESDSFWIRSDIVCGHTFLSVNEYVDRLLNSCPFPEASKEYTFDTLMDYATWKAKGENMEEAKKVVPQIFEQIKIQHPLCTLLKFKT